jgi:hypothetical protein
VHRRVVNPVENGLTPSLSFPMLERKGMRIDRASARQGGRNSMIRTGDEPHDDPLERITKDGSATREPTQKQMKGENRTVGSAIKANCFICRKFLKKDDLINYQHTIWQCKRCQMPLCKMSRVDPAIGRTDACQWIHQQSSSDITGCSGGAQR